MNDLYSFLHTSFVPFVICGLQRNCGGTLLINLLLHYAIFTCYIFHFLLFIYLCFSFWLDSIETFVIAAGILDASRQRHNHLWRSKSETNLKQPLRSDVANSLSPSDGAPRSGAGSVGIAGGAGSGGSSAPSSPMRVTEMLLDAVDGGPALTLSVPATAMELMPPLDVGDAHRPKSWSPDDSLANNLFPQSPDDGVGDDLLLRDQSSAANRAVCVSLRVPCSNGWTYSVSQNRAVQLDSSPPQLHPAPPPLSPPQPVLMDNAVFSHAMDYSLEPEYVPFFT